MQWGLTPAKLSIMVSCSSTGVSCDALSSVLSSASWAGKSMRTREEMKRMTLFHLALHCKHATSNWKIYRKRYINMWTQTAASGARYHEKNTSKMKISHRVLTANWLFPWRWWHKLVITILNPFLLVWRHFLWLCTSSTHVISLRLQLSDYVCVCSHNNE